MENKRNKEKRISMMSPFMSLDFSTGDLTIGNTAVFHHEDGTPANRKKTMILHEQETIAKGSILSKDRKTRVSPARKALPSSKKRKPKADN